MTWHINGPFDGPLDGLSSILYAFSPDVCQGQFTWGLRTVSLTHSLTEVPSVSPQKSCRAQRVFPGNVTCRRKEPVGQTVCHVPDLHNSIGRWDQCSCSPVAVSTCLLKSQTKFIARKRFELFSPKSLSYFQLQEDERWKYARSSVLTHFQMSPLHVPAC